MKKIVCLLISVILWNFPAFAEDAAARDSANVREEQPQTGENLADLVHHTHYGEMPEIKELPKDEDDLYSGAEVKPMTAKISEDEKQQDLSTDLDYVDKEFVLPELLCSDEKLRHQVAVFIQNNTKDNESSVKGRRSRLLMIKNLHGFEEVSEEELANNKNFKLRAAVAHLRINANREIYRVCESKNNNAGRHNNVYIIIYPYFKYYKVAVTNLMSTTETIDEATFTYNW